ncbi:MAG TPA: hypothetical protein V6C65_18220 [Allocoleopsis sp.]
MEQPIEKNLWWVIPGKLAGVRKPTAEEISQLQAVGVGAIISVMMTLLIWICIEHWWNFRCCTGCDRGIVHLPCSVSS